VTFKAAALADCGPPVEINHGVEISTRRPATIRAVAIGKFSWLGHIASGRMRADRAS